MTANDLTLKMGRLSRMVLADIIRDIRDGCYDEDAVLASFSDLHDHVDANDYVVDLFPFDTAEDALLFQNAITDDIDAFLKRHPITVPGERCVVCNAPNIGEDAGWAQGHAGFMPVCSDACTDEFYAHGGGMLEPVAVMVDYDTLQPVDPATLPPVGSATVDPFTVTSI